MLPKVFAVLSMMALNSGAMSSTSTVQSVLSSADNEPFVQIVPKPSIYNVGDRKAIYCKGGNLKEPLTWYGPDGKLLEGRSDPSNRISVEKQNGLSATVLLIQSVQIGDTGNWTCRSGNTESTISVLVGERAEIKPMVDVVGEERSKVTLKCNAKGIPLPEAQWYRGHRISEDSNPQKYVVEKKGTVLSLTIKNLTHEDSGEYTCKVTQKALSYYTDRQVVVNVRHKPMVRFVHESEIYVLYNETKNITCNIQAYPAPEYKWYRTANNYDEPIENEETVYISEDRSYSALLLRVYSEDDLGAYKCTAANTKGTISVVFDVSLGNKPDPPNHVELISSSLDELVFNVTCSKCWFASDDTMSPQADNLTVTGYSFQLVPVQEGFLPNWDVASTVMVDVVDPANTTFPVGNLSNSTTFYVRVQTCNQAGCSEWLDVHPNPKTTDFGVYLTATPILVLMSGIILLF